tara:strand:+ start:1321 stop:1575 length:255 start_codon:yes stop_codon:yes gene_type:complete
VTIADGGITSRTKINGPREAPKPFDQVQSILCDMSLFSSKNGIAKTGGSLSWQDDDADDKLKKQKQALANKLKQSFGLSEDPLP